MPETTIPQTAEYLVLGLVVVFILSAGFVLSLVARWRNANRDIQTLTELENES